MKIVVIGGSGLIGSRVVARLRAQGHEAAAASPASGVNAVTGQGLDAALAGAQVVVDVANSPSFAPDDVMAFFRASTSKLAAAEAKAGVMHHVALSIVGTERLPDSGYFLAKLEQERLIKASPVPWTIVRATQFFEFLAAIGQGSAQDGEARLPTALMQPVAADDVADAVADAALAAPRNGTVEVAGPQALPMDHLVRRALQARGDGLRVVGDAQARYFGAAIDDRSLTPAPGGHARIGALPFEAWLARQAV
ncbi:MAG: NmrA family transcriptional regulator [Aquabacterium sp.]|jgi:uncharacterized protein YbjT (DUF2867 family)|nr:MAG: NmrA family transcriptional regulator [Aquabacterium sp.]